MEKVLVVTGIWAMCALCFVLFIRGASSAEARRDTLAPERAGKRPDVANG